MKNLLLRPLLLSAILFTVLNTCSPVVTAGTHENQTSAPEEKGITSLIRFIAGYSDDPKSNDPFVVYYNSASTYSFDGQYDALKLFNSDVNVTNFYIFGNDSSRLSINAVPFDCTGSSCTMFLGLKTDRSATVVFRIRDITGLYVNQSVTLTDKVTGINTSLVLGSEYSIYLPAGDYTDRFSITMGSVLTGIPEYSSTGNVLESYTYHGVIRSNINSLSGSDGILIICNMGGQVLYNKKITDSGYIDFKPSVGKSVYIVSYISGKERFSKKVYFNQ